MTVGLRCEGQRLSTIRKKDAGTTQGAATQPADTSTTDTRRTGKSTRTTAKYQIIPSTAMQRHHSRVKQREGDLAAAPPLRAAPSPPRNVTIAHVTLFFADFERRGRRRRIERTRHKASTQSALDFRLAAASTYECLHGCHRFGIMFPAARE